MDGVIAADENGGRVQKPGTEHATVVLLYVLIYEHDRIPVENQGSVA